MLSCTEYYWELLSFSGDQKEAINKSISLETNP